MSANETLVDHMPVVARVADFDRNSGSWLERLIFNHRRAVVILCALLTAVLGFSATKVGLNASFEKMIPQGHPYIRNYLDNKSQLRGLGNSVRIIVENESGDVFDPAYLETLKKINDEVFLTPGVDRAWMRSLWTPNVRWTEVTEDGFRGGPVMPDSYDGSQLGVEQLRTNVARAGLVGGLIANDFRSSAIFVPLLDHDPTSGAKLDYWKFSRTIEDRVRAKYDTAAATENSSANAKAPKIHIRVIGFAMIIAALLDGMLHVMLYFVGAFAIAAAILFAYTRCLRSTALVLACSLIAVAWQIGLVALIGLELDPYTVLVPFLVFAIGVSHGAQKMNGVMQDIGRGTHRLVSARYTFRRLFLAGLTALVADAVGFAVLMMIDIPVIRDLALTASIGVGVLVFTNLVLLPVLLSYMGVSARAAARSLREELDEEKGRGVGALWQLLDRFAENRRWAMSAVLASAVLALAGIAISQNLKVGDLDPGAPELRPQSRYNRDNAYVTAHYALSSDVFAVIVKTPTEGCLKYQTLLEADRLGWELQQLPQTQTTISLANAVRQITAGSFEGNPKWQTISRNQDMLNYGAQQASVNNPDLFNTECSVMPVLAYLTDHKAESLEGAMKVAEKFIAARKVDDAQFLPIAGSAGIEAVTNAVVRDASRTMLIYVYLAVICLCFITFRSWRAVVVAVVPLMITSILCEALMVILGIGIKVATLPVIALGVGIGVDYALYLLSLQLAGQRMGLGLPAAFARAVQFTGKVVALVGITLAAGVVTWVWSPIKFQADMGFLLTFMFIWNMLGALVLIPALSHFLLNDSKFMVVPLPSIASKGGT